MVGSVDHPITSIPPFSLESDYYYYLGILPMFRSPSLPTVYIHVLGGPSAEQTVPIRQVRWSSYEKCSSFKSFIVINVFSFKKKN